MDGIVFLAEESEGTSREPRRLLRPPSLRLPVCLSLRAALLFRHISTPSHFFLLRLQTPLNSIFPTPFYFSATSSFLFFPPVIFFSPRQATLSTPPPPPHPPPSLPVCFFSVQFHSRTDYRAAEVTPRRYISVNVGRAPRSLPGENVLFFHVKMSVHWLGP